jgi:hypothetical protein
MVPAGEEKILKIKSEHMIVLACIAMITIVSLSAIFLPEILGSEKQKAIARSRSNQVSEQDKKGGVPSQELIDEFGIMGAADASSKGMSPKEYRLLKETAEFKRELDRSR